MDVNWIGLPKTLVPQMLPERAGSTALAPERATTWIRLPKLSNCSTPSSRSPTQRSPATLQVRLSGNGEEAKNDVVPVDGSNVLDLAAEDRG